MLKSVGAEWRATGEDVARLTQLYLEQHQEELDSLIASRTARYATTKQAESLGEDEIRRRAYAGETGFEGIEVDLLEPEKLRLLVRLASDPACPTRTILFAALYGIIGAVGTELLGGKEPSDPQAVLWAINEAKGSADDQLVEWGLRAEALLAQPDPLEAMNWMDLIFRKSMGLD